jgi:hypothetical protein
LPPGERAPGCDQAELELDLDLDLDLDLQEPSRSRNGLPLFLQSLVQFGKVANE